MGLSRFLRSIAVRAEARVFSVPGCRFRQDARLLHLRDGIRLAATPRAANLLLLVGELDAGLVAPALVGHDALSPPRATVWWRRGAQAPLVRANFPQAVVVDEADPVPTLRRVHEELVTGAREGEPALLPDTEPAAWRGVGPYGQGGKAMTGGVPYGRPMAERADDRDGLKLDYLPVRVGPLFAPFPVGLALDLKLQGDVILEATLENHAGPRRQGDSIFDRALREPVPVRDLEVARARSHLQWLSDAVAMAGSESLCERILRLAQRVGPGEGYKIRRLERSLRRLGFLGRNTRGVAVLHGDDLDGVTGPVARASGLRIDARSEDSAYRQLDFRPLVQETGDAAARWVQRLRESAQALDLAGRAGDLSAGGSGIVESPRGSLSERQWPSRATTRLVTPLITGMEWGDAVTTVVSLDLDMAEAPALEHAGTGS